jgi:hypothetical protein
MYCGRSGGRLELSSIGIAPRLWKPVTELPLYNIKGVKESTKERLNSREVGGVAMLLNSQGASKSRSEW